MLEPFSNFLYIDGSLLDLSWYFPISNTYCALRLKYRNYLVVVDDAHLLLNNKKKEPFVESLITFSKFLILMGL